MFLSTPPYSPRNNPVFCFISCSGFRERAHQHHLQQHPAASLNRAHPPLPPPPRNQLQLAPSFPLLLAMQAELSLLQLPWWWIDVRRCVVHRAPPACVETVFQLAPRSFALLPSFFLCISLALFSPSPAHFHPRKVNNIETNPLGASTPRFEEGKRIGLEAK